MNPYEKYVSVTIAAPIPSPAKYAKGASKPFSTLRFWIHNL